MSAFTEADERMLQELLAKKEREKQALEDIEAGKEQERTPVGTVTMGEPTLEHGQLNSVDADGNRVERTRDMTTGRETVSTTVPNQYLTGDTSGRVPERTTAQRMRDLARRAAGAASMPGPLAAGLKKSIAKQPKYIGRENSPTEQPHSLTQKKDK